MKKLILTALSLFLVGVVFSQNVGIGTNTPDPSAKLEVSSNNSGFLLPRMSTAERNAIGNPAVGLQIYNTTSHCLEIFDFGKWNPVYCVTDPGTLMTDIDGNSYPTTKICDQTWTAKNLNVSRYRNGDIIPQVTNPTEWANLTTGAWCWYNNDSATYGSVYGKLYNWYAVNDPRGLAPDGWHVPSDGEWKTFTKCIDSNADTTCQVCTQSLIAGGKLKSVSGWYPPNVGASNSSGFNGLPNGKRNHDATFEQIGNFAPYWSSSEDIATNFGWLYYLSTFDAASVRDDFFKNAAFAIRCIKDTPITTLNNGLVAYYPFSGNAGDSSGNGNHGTVNGATLTTDRFGNTGKAYSFNGNTDNISIPHSNSLAIEGNITISVWKKSLGNTGNYETFLSKRDANGNWNYSLNASHYYGPGGCPAEVNKYMTARRNNGGAEYELKYSDTLVSTSVNVWTNVIVVINNNTAKFYIDGVQTGYSCFGDTFSISSIDTGAPLTIGSCNCGLSEYFNGSLDEIRIYNRVLTQAEITYLANH
jgi:uncharacterized protein (TIGR02145 family)